MSATAALLDRLGIAHLVADGDIVSRSPIDGARLGAVKAHNAAEVDAALAQSAAAFKAWRTVPAPRRGELIRLFGEVLREHKADLGALVTLEAGKIVQEGLGEVQEMIDICDFAVGLSRQLHGLTIASERPRHRMVETWQPLGPVAIITAFNFPVAVWAWNAALALVCGDPVIWKPSEKTPLTALATQALFEKALARFGDAPEGLSQLLFGLRAVGEQIAADPRVPLVSATGSTRMGREVAPVVAKRFGRSILELGGNNAMIVTPSADLKLAVRAILFAAVGTAGQRCTTLRRLIVHNDCYDKVVSAVKTAFAAIQPGDPRHAGTLMGPLIDKAAFDAVTKALEAAKAQGGTVHGGGRALSDIFPEAWYAYPAIAEMPSQTEIVKHETFGPILYVLRYSDFEEAVAMQNDVPQGLSSSIMTRDLLEAERFLAPDGSDCGIANVNMGPSGAEIGGAFGGEKETGGGRESGSDSWKQYMRRQTSAINYGTSLPLAQGIEFPEL
ncbi:aldehyde dehydrogenase family protein [Niveispirillum lacus]|uniref:aldehyde dehydrogenase (NAD(+)) n=1 Tax=Niveispirillum lacus TaxID=1981099 RepID=A0A255Z2D3_9PROT|nr:aldehyde dehydrogenase family protein [Niveispirillum lacus]OYQ35612.1 aldehyde dehydrogenase family protein [Niveispirillum lacus]